MRSTSNKQCLTLGTLRRRRVGRQRLGSVVAATGLGAIALVAGPARAATYVWDNTTGNWSDPARWTPAMVPPSSPATVLQFGSGAADYVSTYDLATPFQLNALQLEAAAGRSNAITALPVTNTLEFLANGAAQPSISMTGGGTFRIASNVRFGTNANLTLNVAGGSELTTTGVVTYTGTINKTGAGLWRIGGGNGAFNAASVLNVNAGQVLLTDITGGDLNAAAINVNDGGTFTFGGGNPDLPNNSYVTANAGGTVVWNTGENFGGLNLFGGTVRMAGNINVDGAVPSDFRSGTISLDANTPSINGNGVINKTTAGTVTVNGIPLNNNGGLNLREGVLETNTGIGGTGPLTFGTAATAGTLRYTGFGGPLAKPVTVDAGGGTIDVTLSDATLTATGVASGPGGLTKAGPGLLVLTANNTYAGTTTINGGTLQLGDGGIAGTLAGNVVTNATLAFNRSNDVTFGGSISGTGGVRKLAGNTVTLAGALSYAGATTVEAGTLRVSPFAAGAIDLFNGTTLAVVNGSTAGTLSAASLNLGAGGTTLRLELNAAGNPAVPLVNVTTPDGLNLNGGTHTLSVANASAFAIGSFTLIDYAGAPISSGFTLAPLPARTQGGLVYDTANTQVKLDVTGVDSIRWNGNLSADWDAGSAVNVGGTFNWRLASNNAATNFVPNDVVVFDDSAAGTTSVNLPANVQPASMTVDNAAKPYTFSGPGAVTGAASLTKRGTGALTILTNNENAGGTTVTAGSLQIGDGGTSGAIGSGDLTNNGSVAWNRSDDLTFPGNIAGSGSLAKQGVGTLTLGGTYTMSGNTALAGGTLELNPTTPYVYPGQISGAGGLLKSGPVAVTLGGNNTYTGGTRIAAGTLQVGDGGTAGALAGNVTNDGTLAFNRSDASTFAGTISGAGGLSHLGGGTTTLSGALTYAGPTVVSAGTVNMTGANALTGAVTVAGGAALSVDTSAGDQIFAAVVGGAGTLTKSGTGSLTLTANNNPFTGTFNVNGGRALLSDPNVAGGDLGAAAININNGGTFEFGQGGVTGENPDLPDSTFITVNSGGTLLWRISENLGGVNLQGGTITLAGGNINSVATAQSWTSGTLNGSNNGVAGTAVVTKTTAGTVTVAAAATIRSTLDLQEGTVALVEAANLGTAAVQLGAGGTGGTVGTFEYQGATSASRAGGFTLNGRGGVRVLSASAALTLTGAITGVGSLNKDGPGTLILTGNNTFAGGTTITAGTLLGNGQTGTNSATGTGPVTITAAGTLGGTGSIAGPLTVVGTISPGASAGQLAVGSTTLEDGGAYQFEISDAAGTAGLPAGWDLLQGRPGAPLTIASTPAAPFVINVVSLDATQAPGSAQNFDSSQPYTFLIGSFPGGISGFDPSAIVASSAAFANPTNGGTFSVMANGTDLNLVYTPVPEPAGLALLGVAAAGLLKRRRRGVA